jgi:hypothetical protein
VRLDDESRPACLDVEATQSHNESQFDSAREFSSPRLYLRISKLRQRGIGISHRRIDSPFGKAYSYLIETALVALVTLTAQSSLRPDIGSNAYVEYTFVPWLGRSIYRRTVDLSAICIQ